MKQVHLSLTIPPRARFAASTSPRTKCIILHVNQCLDRSLDRQENDAASPAPSVGTSSGGAIRTPGTTGRASGTAGTKRETAIGLDDLDNEVQIVSEERPGKRRAVERQLLQGNRSAAQRLPLQLAARQHVLVVCGEGSKQQRITLRLQPRVPLIYLYSVRRAPNQP